MRDVHEVSIWKFRLSVQHGFYSIPSAAYHQQHAASNHVDQMGWRGFFSFHCLTSGLKESSWQLWAPWRASRGLSQFETLCDHNIIMLLSARRGRLPSSWSDSWINFKINRCVFGRRLQYSLFLMPDRIRERCSSLPITLVWADQITITFRNLNASLQLVSSFRGGHTICLRIFEGLQALGVLGAYHNTQLCLNASHKFSASEHHSSRDHVEKRLRNLMLVPSTFKIWPYSIFGSERNCGAMYFWSYHSNITQSRFQSHIITTSTFTRQVSSVSQAVS